MVVGVLHPDQPGAEVRLQSMRAVAETGLIAGGGAVLALLLNGFGIPHAWVWRMSGLVVSITWLIAFGHAMRRFTEAGEPPFRRGSSDALRFYFIAPAVPLGNLLLLWNVISPGGAAGARHAAALSLALVISAERFVSAAFLPRRPAA
jgi:hypothetical protein